MSDSATLPAAAGQMPGLGAERWARPVGGHASSVDLMPTANEIFGPQIADFRH